MHDQTQERIEHGVNGYGGRKFRVALQMLELRVLVHLQRLAYPERESLQAVRLLVELVPALVEEILQGLQEESSLKTKERRARQLAQRLTRLRCKQH